MGVFQVVQQGRSLRWLAECDADVEEECHDTQCYALVQRLRGEAQGLQDGCCLLIAVLPVQQQRLWVAEVTCKSIVFPQKLLIRAFIHQKGLERQTAASHMGPGWPLHAQGGAARAGLLPCKMTVIDGSMQNNGHRWKYGIADTGMGLQGLNLAPPTLLSCSTLMSCLLSLGRSQPSEAAAAPRLGLAEDCSGGSCCCCSADDCTCNVGTSEVKGLILSSRVSASVRLHAHPTLTQLIEPCSRNSRHIHMSPPLSQPACAGLHFEM